ncbi:hypothetical protein CHARACLAT_024857 [Characodon lateralis]|uniref:Uncharacterized protein n=1 Tax=Characodon lateralis TaxID=208331 RepID=A0ABU7CU24_9TELE|nr:hypothetical protein [Characodon lateralis]
MELIHSLSKPRLHQERRVRFGHSLPVKETILFGIETLFCEDLRLENFRKQNPPPRNMETAQGSSCGEEYGKTCRSMGMITSSDRLSKEREAAKRPMVTLEELETPKAQVGKICCQNNC